MAFLLHVDLISKSTFSGDSLSGVKEKVRSSNLDDEFLTFVLEVMGSTKDGKMEIYVEDSDFPGESSEELLKLIKDLEETVGGFISGSTFEVGGDYPGSTEKWVKGVYSWEVEDSLDDPWEWGKDSWGDEWEENEEEWN